MTSIDNPYDLYREMRDEGAVVELGDGVWAVTRYGEIATVLSDDLNFGQPVAPLGDEVDGLAGVDPPAHTRQRRAVGDAWTARRTQTTYQPIVCDVIATLVDGLRPKRTADLIGHFASPMAHQVLAGVLGIPRTDLEQVVAWVEIDSESLAGHLDDDAQRTAANARTSLRAYLADLISVRRSTPTDDAISRMAKPRGSPDERISDAELISVIQQSLVAGTETVKNLVGMTMHTVLGTPGLALALRQHPTQIANTIEEALRHDAPVQCLVRRVRHATVLGGVTIPAGASLLILYGAANRDPRQFSDPERFDPYRTNASEHVSLGHGIHFCLGAPLARMEARIAVETLLTRLPNLRLRGASPATWIPHPLWRRMGSLDVEWDVT